MTLCSDQLDTCWRPVSYDGINTKIMDCQLDKSVGYLIFMDRSLNQATSHMLFGSQVLV